jgi:type IV pilus assembly protein PilA
MSQQSSEGMPTGLKVLIGVGAGCGCLFVGVVLLGIISAIALPSFLNQANKAKESEGKQAVGAMLRDEQAYFLENNKFTENIADLGIRSPGAASINYSYQLQKLPGAVPAVAIKATPLGPKSLAGFIGIVAVEGKSTQVLLCKTQMKGAMTAQIPTKLTVPLACPSGTLPVP